MAAQRCGVACLAALRPLALASHLTRLALAGNPCVAGLSPQRRRVLIGNLLPGGRQLGLSGSWPGTCLRAARVRSAAWRRTRLAAHNKAGQVGAGTLITELSKYQWVVHIIEMVQPIGDRIAKLCKCKACKQYSLTLTRQSSTA